MADLASAPSKETVEKHENDVHVDRRHMLEENDLQQGAIDKATAAVLLGQDLVYSEEEERRVVRKIDWIMMPIMAVACGIQFVDKAAIGNAATFGMSTDLKLVGQEYSWGVSIFYFGYIASLPPSLYLMQRFNTARSVGVACVLWGACILGMVGMKNYATMLFLRFMLGVFEAPLAPGFIQITTRFYTQKEQPFRFGIWTILNGWLPIPFLVIYYYMGQIKSGDLAPWRYIFLLLGLITVIIGLLVFFLIPDTPTSAYFLSPREKAIAVERVAKAQSGIKNTEFKKEQFVEALTDVRAWLVVLTLFLSQSGGAVTTSFLGLVIKGFGFSQLRSLLLQTPAFAIQGVICLIVTGLATFTRTFRHLKQPMLSLAACCVITGASVIYSHKPTANNKNLLLGMLYLIALNNCSYTTILSVVGTNFTGQTKKSTISGMVFIAYCVSNIVVPQAFRGTEAPTYHSGILTVLCFQVALVICYWTSWALMSRENARRDRLGLGSGRKDAEGNDSDGPDEKEEILQGLKDLTDRQNMSFRYSP